MFFDAVYPLGNGSRFGNDEIRYSIRSLLKHCLDLRNIFIIGSQPNFFRYGERLQHIPFTENGHGPAYNGWHKAMLASRTDEISAQFLLMYDDIFICQNFSIATLPYFTRATNATRQPSVRAAFRELKKAGKPQRNFATHLPIRMSKSELTEVDCLYGRTNGLSLRVIVGNHFGKPGKFGDGRTVRRVPNTAFLDRMATGRIAFEARTSVQWETMKPWLDARYPKTEFEV